MEIVLIIIGINILAFVTPFVVQFTGSYPTSYLNFVSMGWKNNSDIAGGEYYRLLTSTFLHDVDIFHLLFNMWSLWNISPLMLQLFKPGGFLIIYLVSGVVGSYLSFLFNTSNSLGASGSIFGLLGALLAYSVLGGRTDLLTSILINIFIIVAYSFLPGARIDNFGHLGGLLAGFVIGFIFLIGKFQLAV